MNVSKIHRGYLVSTNFNTNRTQVWAGNTRIADIYHTKTGTWQVNMITQPPLKLPGDAWLSNKFSRFDEAVDQSIDEAKNIIGQPTASQMQVTDFYASAD